MKETFPYPNPQEHIPHEFHAAEVAGGFRYSILVAHGLERAGMMGFSFENVIIADGTPPEQVESRKHEIQEKTTELAGWLELDENFFEKPANTVLLASVADSLLQSEKSDDSPDRKEKQQAVLQDIAYMLCGPASARVASESAQDMVLRDRYVSEQEDKNDKEVDEFYESITDHELTSAVDALLRDRGENSFLASQREALGINGEEKPFTVRVITAGDEVDMFRAHIQIKPVFPDWKQNMNEAERKIFQEESDSAISLIEQNRKQTQALQDNLEAYEARFKEEFGPMPIAAVVKNKNTGKNELTIRAPHALAMLKYLTPGAEMPADEQERHDIEGIGAIIRHEYGHTQKIMTIGAHDQLGLILEERKAEMVSGDKHGYQDVKFLFDDIGAASGVSVVEMLRNSLKEEDSISAFVCAAASGIGLRNTLLLMSLKPLPYDKNPSYAKKFPDVAGAYSTAEDVSSLDIPVREILDKHGDATLVDYTAKWAGALNDSLMETAINGVPRYRRNNGHSVAAPYYRQAGIAEAAKRGLSIKAE